MKPTDSKNEKIVPEVSKSEPKGALSEPIGAKRSPKESPSRAKGNLNKTERFQKGAKGRPR